MVLTGSHHCPAAPVPMACACHALIPPGCGHRGVPRRCSPVQATAALACREQEASHSHYGAGDDVRPGRNKGG